MATLSLMVTNELSELSRVTEALAQFADAEALPARVRFELELAVEEILVNVLKYGYDDDQAHSIALSVRYEEGLLSAEISDDGRPFNPLEVAAPDVDAPPGERPLGGLGIYLVKQTMDRLSYRREAGRNYLLMQKWVLPEKPDV